MADEKSPVERADVLKMRPAPSGLRLQREFLVRALRSLQVMNGYDPQVALPEQIPDLRLTDHTSFNALIHDATVPPFRNNGKGVMFTAARAAGGAGNFNEWLMQVVPSPNAGLFGVAVVVDELVYAGPSDATYGLTLGTDPPIATFTRCISTEEPFGKIDGANTTTGRPRRVDDVQGQSGVFGAAPTDGTTWDVLGFLGQTPATGPASTERLGQLVLWPRMGLLIVQDTANVAGRLTIKGRVFNFGSPGTSLQT